MDPHQTVEKAKKTARQKEAVQEHGRASRVVSQLKKVVAELQASLQFHGTLRDVVKPVA